MTRMKKQPMISLIICTMFILIATQTHSSLQILSNPQSDLSDQKVEWNDGTFSGYWIDSESTTQGTLQGILSMARSEQSGIFSGKVTDNENQQIGQFNGRFLKKIIIGFFQSDDADISNAAFFGKIITRDDITFTAKIFPLSTNTITINCTYQFSFLPSPTGPYAIGITDQYMIDTSREEYYTENISDYREFMLKIWYPINPETAMNPVDYMDYFTFQWLKNRSPVPLFTIKDDAYLSISPHGFQQGILPTDQQTFPILIFSPGYDGNVEIYTTFIEEMVSQGYIVFSMNHPYVSGLTIFPDGRMIKSTSIKPFSFESIVGDALFVLDYIEGLHENNSIFKDRLDLDHIGMYGHSFGGAATLEVMKQDDRVTAGLTLDGAIGSDILPESFDKAFLMMLAEESFAENTSKQLLNISGEDGYILTIMGSTHYAFTDVGLLMSHFIPLIPPQYLLFGTIDAKRMVNITRSYCREFFDVYLKNEPVENLLDLQMVFEEAVLTGK